MGKFKGIILSFICIICTFMVYNNKVYADTNNSEKIEVLFISSFNFDFISFNDQLEGIKKGFNNNCNINIEYMDFKIFDSYQAEENFYNLIKYKVETYEDIDIIIAGDDEATEFCIKYRDDLFSGIPISFLGVQDYVRRDRALQYDLVSGVTEVESIEENIELITKFHPKVDTITFIDCYGVNLYEEIISKYDDLTFNWIITNDTPIDIVGENLGQLDKNDAIIKLYVDKFSDNDYLTTIEVDKMINNSCNDIPIYNILTYDIGQGSVGGKVINHFNQGEKAGEIAVALLEDKDKEDIYISDDSANDYIFDYKSLRKFGIKIYDLPENSIVINSPIDVIKEYKDIIIANMILLLSLVVIIIALILYISSKRKYEKEILKAMNAAEEANRVKAHFISNISHELRTPINVIMSAIQLFKVNDKKELNISKYINNLDVINDNCKRLMRLINNIIDMQKVELEKEKLELTNINVVELIEEVVTSVIPYVESKNLSLVFDTTEEEVIMKVDIDKFERIILNLLSNAIKFSKENGEIRVNLKFEDYFYVIIEDEGIGMDSDSINNIFEKFVQLDNSLYRKNEGSGMGLAIVKSFVELHNGKIYVDSKINIGSQFILKFPINNEEAMSNYIFDKANISDKVRMELADIYL